MISLVDLIFATCIFVLAMLGHFVGDYLLQNNWMALNKTKRNKLGWLACGTHVVIYATCVMFFLSLSWHDLVYYPIIWLVIAVPHYLIDHYSLASYIMKFKNGVMPLETIEDTTVESIWKAAFTAPVYIVNDNTLHWVMLYFTCWFISKWLLNT